MKPTIEYMRALLAILDENVSLRSELAAAKDRADGLFRDLERMTLKLIDAEKALDQNEHIVVLSDNGWSVEHLVECRHIPNGMTKCAVHEALAVFSDELLDDHGYGRFRLVGWDDDYPMLAPVAESQEVFPAPGEMLTPGPAAQAVAQAIAQAPFNPFALEDDCDADD